MPRKLDLTGHKYGNWEVLYESSTRSKSGAVKWHCRCACGTEKDVIGADLRNGASKSCGCLCREITSKNNRRNLENQRFGKLTVLEATEKRHAGMIVWKCQCDCGNITFVPTSYLTTGDTKSCGCYHKEKMHELCAIDLTGQKFGKLTVLEETDQRCGKSIMWKCQCECGGIAIIAATSLRRGLTLSCGCLKSKGEFLISDLLLKQNISFKKQASFPSCVFADTNTRAYFDFFVNNQYLIEYDGEQHFSANERGWNTKENLQKTQQRDAYKNQWCKDNNIPLIRIPYTHLDKLQLEDLLLETSQFLINTAQ